MVDKHHKGIMNQIISNILSEVLINYEVERDCSTKQDWCKSELFIRISREENLLRRSDMFCISFVFFKCINEDKCTMKSNTFASNVSRMSPVDSL